MKRLESRVAIVTGASAGIGKGIALGFAKEGAKVVITARNEERLQKAAKEIKAAGSEVLALRSDVSVLSDNNELVRKTLERFGQIDILVNNAGVFNPQPFFEKTEKTFDWIVGINFKGLYFLTQAVARHMVERKYGKIINISSGHGRIGVPGGHSEYSASKGAVIALTRSLAVELGPFGINVNGVAAGLTLTEGLEAIQYPQEARNMVLAMTPLRRIGVPEDYVGICLLFATEEGAFITGQTISVDGGVVMP